MQHARLKECASGSHHQGRLGRSPVSHIHLDTEEPENWSARQIPGQIKIHQPGETRRTDKPWHPHGGAPANTQSKTTLREWSKRPSPDRSPTSRVSTLEVNATLIHHQATLQNSHEVSGGNGSMRLRMERLVLLFNYADE
jgi:hypothetical protein